MPVLLAVGVVAALVAVVVAPGLGRRLRAAVLAVVPVALLGPWVLQFVDEPRLLLTGQGLLDVGPDSPPAWQLALAQPDGGSSLVGLLFVPVLVVAVVALARRSGGRPRSVALTALTVTALVGLALAYLFERVGVGQAIGDDGQPTLATLWAGVGLELYVVAVLGILLVGWHGLAHVLGERRFGWRRFVAAAVAAVLAGGLAVAAGLTAWAGAGALQLGSETYPAVAVEQANGPDANRLVVLTPSADRLDFAVIGNEPGDLMRDVERAGRRHRPRARAAARHDRLGGLVPGGAGDALADLGVGFVSVEATADRPAHPHPRRRRRAHPARVHGRPDAVARGRPAVRGRPRRPGSPVASAPGQRRGPPAAGRPGRRSARRGPAGPVGRRVRASEWSSPRRPSGRSTPS